MRRFSGLGPIVILLAVAGCRGPAEPVPAIAVRCKIVPQPPRVGPAEIALSLVSRSPADQEEKPVTGARVALEADMSHPGMAPVFGEALEREDGFYKGRLDFAMPGDWILVMHIQLADGRKLERHVEIRGVQSDRGR
jgi:hypothetical protein